MLCRWSTSSDYRRIFVCFFKSGRILLGMCREKNEYLNRGGDFGFFVLYFMGGGCNAGAVNE